MEAKIAEVGLMLEKDYDPAQKGGVIQYLDDLEATWALYAHMDPTETASSRAKIRLVINKLGNQGFDPYITQALEKDSTTWDGFIKSLRTSLKFVHRMAIQTAKWQAHRASRTSTQETPRSTLPNLRYLMHTKQDPISQDHHINRMQWKLMKEIDPEFLTKCMEACAKAMENDKDYKRDRGKRQPRKNQQN